MEHRAWSIELMAKGGGRKAQGKKDRIKESVDRNQAKREL
jgi:hypothetical protein